MKTMQIDAEQKKKQAHELYANRKFRAAREIFKELCKIDRVQFLPLLIECYAGQIEQLIEKQQYSEAEVILNQIKSLVGENDAYARSKKLIRNVLEKKVIEQVYLPKNLACAPVIDDRTRTIDQSILLFDVPKAFIEEEPALAKEIRCLHTAFERICTSDIAGAGEALRPIAFNSPVSQWKILVKGIILFYEKEDTRAIEAFVKLRPNSIPWKVALPYWLLIDKKSTLLETWPHKQKLMGDACILANEAEVADSLPRAHYLWQAGRYRDSLLAMRSLLKKFPAPNGLLGCVSTFYYNELNVPERHQPKYIDLLVSLYSNPTCKNHYESFLILKKMIRSMMQEMEQIGSVSDKEANLMIKEFIGSYGAVFPESGKAESIVYLAFADYLSKKSNQSGVFHPLAVFDKKQSSSGMLQTAAKAFFEKSIATGHALPAAYAGLFNVVKKTGKKREIENLAVSMVEKFGNDKPILTTVATYLLNSNKFAKAIVPFKKLRSLDPLDMFARKGLLIGLYSCAREAAEKRKIQLVHSYMKQAVDHALSESSDFTIGTPYLYIRWAAYLYLSGSAGEGRAKLEEAALAPHDIRAVYFAYCMFAVCGVADPVTNRLLSMTDTFMAKDQTVGAFVKSIAVYEFLCTIIETNSVAASARYLASREKERLAAFFVRVTQGGEEFSRSVAEKVLRFFLGAGGIKKAADVLIKYFLAKDPKDPLFRFLKLCIANPRIAEYGFLNYGKNYTTLEEIQREAHRRGETALEAEIETIFEKSESGFGKMPTPGQFADFLDKFGNIGKEEFERRFNDLIPGRNPPEKKQTHQKSPGKKSVPVPNVAKPYGRGTTQNSGNNYSPDAEQLELPF